MSPELRQTDMRTPKRQLGGDAFAARRFNTHSTNGTTASTETSCIFRVVHMCLVTFP